MIVWVNGGFGSGKTTLVEEIARRRPEATIFDPEQIGHFLREALSDPVDDFQDLASWRDIVAGALLTIQRHHPGLIVVPMTLIDQTYRQEIFGALAAGGEPVLEVFLEVPSDELARRVNARVLIPQDPVRDADARAFCLRKIDQAVSAVDRLGSDVVVLAAGKRPPSELADVVLGLVGGDRPPRVQSNSGESAHAWAPVA